ncbi:glycogen/starch/alpha-glucan phosphorylase [Clostridium sp. DL1XJH146]
MKFNKNSFKNDFKKKLINLFSVEIDKASNLQKYLALGSLIKDYSAENWMKTNKTYREKGDKQVYYFSMEFLIGRLLKSNLINLGIEKECREALEEIGINFNELEEAESDAGLGNGGLGRLAACFLDSMASIGIPGHGCGIRYRYGLFEQKIVNGYQAEIPDNWLREGNVWETRKDGKAVIVKLGGNITSSMVNGRLNFIHENYTAVKAVPYDTPVIGFENNTVNTLRLWSAELPDDNEQIDLCEFSKGDYTQAQKSRSAIESISSVLYPNDSHTDGKILRLKQQYFMVSAGIQSIIRSYKDGDRRINDFDKHISIHVNDTHPSMAVPELMRILVDDEELTWDEAWRITTNTISYTNHTILSEALEKWDENIFKKLLPRIYTIIKEIDNRFKGEILAQHDNDYGKVDNMAIIHGGKIRMANLAIVGGHSVNGVAKLHTEILKNRELVDFNRFYPNKFNNKTNGITHRRWLIQSNPELEKLINKTIGNSWINDPKKLISLLKFSKDPSFKDKIYEIKQENKKQFADHVFNKYGVKINPNSIYDVQVKRLHAYKRQVLNVLNIMNLYNRLKEDPNLDIEPRTFFFGAKASPSYYLAKETIKLINTVANKINNDKTINDKIKIVFLENYRVSLAEKIIPCADVSEQISTASKEASGTGNMKFMMNGAITLATLDGANIEIRDAVGDDNIVTFGMLADEVMNYEKHGGYCSRDYYNNDNRVKRVIDQMMDGYYGVSHEEFKSIYNALLNSNDEYFVLKDFDSYVKAQDTIDQLYRNRDKWLEMSITNIAHSGIFSSDNTIRAYANEIWNTKPVFIK